MIKVNLLNDKTNTRASGGDVKLYTDMGRTPSSGSDSRALVNLVLLFAGVGLLYYVESQNINRLKNQLSGIQKQYQTVQQELTQLQTKNLNVEEIQKSIDENNLIIEKIENKIAQRLTEVKALDHIQSVIPEKLWLSNLTYGKGNLRILGNSLTTKELEYFVRQLEQESSLFSDIIIVKTQDVKKGNRNLQEFEVTSTIKGGAK